jgi:hypothetical protein
MAARLIFTGPSIEAKRLQMTPATMTATVPLGQAVAIQNADVIAMASAERAAFRAAGTGSDQGLLAGLGHAIVDPPSSAARASRRRDNAWERAHAALARQSVDTAAPFPLGVSSVSRITWPGLSLAPSATEPTPAMSSLATALAWRAASIDWPKRPSTIRASALSKCAEARMPSAVAKSVTNRARSAARPPKSRAGFVAASAKRSARQIS